MHDDKIILYYDGVCNLCNRWVQFVLKHDRKKEIYFMPLQLCPELEKYNSIVLKINGSYLIKSDALLRLCYQIGGWWKLSFVFYLLPKFIRDKAYDFIAFRRYKWFGKTDKCKILSKELNPRLLS